MSIRKYEFTGKKIDLPNGVTVSQIRALRDIPSIAVKKNDLGGWLEFSENLLEENDCWVGENAVVCGVTTVIRDRAYIYGNATIKSSYDSETVIGANTYISGDSVIHNSIITGEDITIRGRSALTNCDFRGKNILIEGFASLEGVSIMEKAKHIHINKKALVEFITVRLLINGESVLLTDNVRFVDVARINGKNFKACDNFTAEQGVVFDGDNTHVSGAATIRGKVLVKDDVHVSDCVTIFNDTTDYLHIRSIDIGGDILLPASRIHSAI